MAKMDWGVELSDLCRPHSDQVDLARNAGGEPKRDSGNFGTASAGGISSGRDSDRKDCRSSGGKVAAMAGFAPRLRAPGKKT